MTNNNKSYSLARKLWYSYLTGLSLMASASIDLVVNNESSNRSKSRELVDIALICLSSAGSFLSVSSLGLMMYKRREGIDIESLSELTREYNNSLIHAFRH